MPLSPNAFELLAILVAERPKAIRLANLVSEIRDAIGDDPSNRRFVRTVRRFGYAFRETANDAETSAPAVRTGM